MGILRAYLAVYHSIAKDLDVFIWKNQIKKRKCHFAIRSKMAFFCYEIAGNAHTKAKKNGNGEECIWLFILRERKVPASTTVIC